MDDWGFPFKSSPKVGGGTAKQQVKNEKWIKKREKSDIQRFQCQAVVFFDIRLKMFLWIYVEVVKTCKTHC